MNIHTYAALCTLTGAGYIGLFRLGTFHSPLAGLGVAVLHFLGIMAIAALCVVEVV